MYFRHTYGLQNSVFFIFYRPSPQSDLAIYNLWIASPSAHNDNFFAYNDVTGGVAGVAQVIR
jgi:hypothetical protein